MLPYKSFIKDNAVSVLGHILIYLRSLLLIPLIVKTVGVTTYGGYCLLSSILAFSFGISSLGVGFRYKRFLPSSSDKYSRQDLFYPQLLFHCSMIIIISLLFIFFGSTLKTIFFKNEVNFSLLLCTIYLFIYFVYSQTNDYFRYSHRIKRSIIQVVFFAYIHVAFIAIVWFAFHNMSVNLLISSEIGSLLIVTIPAILFILHDIGFKLPVIKVKQIIDDIKLGFPLVISYVVDTLLSMSDKFIIAFFLSVTAVGYYNTGYALGAVICLFPKAIGMVLPQFLSKSVDSGRMEEARVMFNYAVKGFLLLAIPFTIGSLVLSKPLLTLIGNEKVAQNAFLVMPIISSGAIFYGLYLLFSNLLFVQMKTIVMLRMNAIVAGLNIILNLILLYIFRNILICAIAMFISYSVIFILIYNVVRKIWPITFEIIIIAKYVLAALIMGAALYYISSRLGADAYRLIYIMSEILIGIIIYFATLFAVKTFTLKEINFFKRVFLYS